MLRLFAIPSKQTLANTLHQLHDGDLANIFGRKILDRGYDYLEAIESLQIQPGTVVAEVYGTEPYELILEHRSGDVYGTCSCPYEGACKHLAALLMHLRDEVDKAELAAINPPADNVSKHKTVSFDFDRHLEALNADELRALVRQFAPESYRRTIAAQHATPETQQKAWQSTDKKVRELLKKAGQYGPEDFEAELVKRLDVLRPFWLNHTVVVTKLLYDCILAIDEAQGEGLLYDDYADGVFDGDDLGMYMAAFVAAQPVDRLPVTLQSLQEAFQECEFSLCANFLSALTSSLSEAKRRAVLPIFLRTDALVGLEDRHQRVIWQHLQPVLNVDEQRQLLSKLQGNQFFVLELASLLERNGETEQAIQLLDDALPRQEQPSVPTYFGYAGGWDKSKLFERRIEMEQQHRQGRGLHHWATRYVQEVATAQSLHFALNYLPQQQKTLEKSQRGSVRPLSGRPKAAGRCSRLIPAEKGRTGLCHAIRFL